MPKLYNYLPEELNINGTVFKRALALNLDKPVKGLKYRYINVLSKNLRGKRDLHGNYYKPTRWLFIEEKIS